MLPRRRLVLLGLLLVSAVAFTRASAAGPEIELQNLDGVPFADRLAFSRIKDFTIGADHETATLRIRNSGTAALAVSQLTVTPPWQFNPKPALPASIAPGGALDVPLRFAATDGDYHSGTLEIVSNDADEARLPVQLAGFWQKQSENNQEPGLGHILRVFGYTTTVVAPGQNLNHQGRVEASGEEVLSPYWRRADAGAPVTVRQLAAFHGCCDPALELAFVQWYPKGNPGARTMLFRHTGVDSQTLLPRMADPATNQPYADNRPAAATWSSPPALFGFRIDGEYSDSALNNPVSGTTTPCTASTCHRVRFWPARDRAGAVIPNTYLMTGDYNTSNPNYDYNDNVYLLGNVTPETPGPTPSAAQALYRLDTGGTRAYLDSNGNWWQPDTGYFSPTTPPPEGITAGQLPTDIALTRDDWLFSSYRGNLGSIPQSQRVFTYNLPVGGAATYTVRLYFAERFWTQSGKRVQDITAEGATITNGSSTLNNFDMFARAGGKDRALVSFRYPVRVTDGALTLAFRADIDQPAVNAIEVYCDAACPGVSPTPSPAPSPAPSPGTSPTTSPIPPSGTLPRRVLIPMTEK